MKYSVAIFMLFLFADASIAQEKNPESCCNVYYSSHAVMDTITVFIEGTVVDGTSGKSVAGIAMELYNDEHTYSVESNANGDFVFYHIPSGKYTLKVNGEKYCSFMQKKLHFGSGGIYEMKICVSRSQ